MMVDPTIPERILAALHHEILSDPAEAVGDLLGIANIVLLTRRSIWNFPVGIAMVSLLGYVFFQQRLYSDTLTQLYFLIFNVIGWVAWLRHREPDGEVIVETSSPRELALYIAGTAACALALGYFMSHVLHAAFPYWDATVASASIIAQLMLTWRRIENWLWWIGANTISIVIYPLKGLYLTAALYAFMMSLSILGFIAWRRKLIAQRADILAPAQA
jgi:nicotinamide mononucleotide transporter